MNKQVLTLHWTDRLANAASVPSARRYGQWQGKISTYICDSKKWKDYMELEIYQRREPII